MKANVRLKNFELITMQDFEDKFNNEPKIANHLDLRSS